jgi:Lon protease-like protein
VSGASFDELGELNLPDSFDGVVRLFPLPNVVLFPGILLPLHIFEPRYRQMLADAMQADRMITMVLLKPDDEESVEGECPIFEVACIGRVVHHEPLADGRSNLVLQGLSRVRIESELLTDRMYRMARVTRLDDHYPASPDAGMTAATERAVRMLCEICRLVGRASDAKKLEDASELPPGRFCDLAAHCLNVDIRAKQELLSELNVMRRLESLLAWVDALLTVLRQRDEPRGQVPPFSMN